MRTIVQTLHARSRIALIAGFLAMMGLWTPETASALPSFAIQTGNPCAACHVGAFGPQLTSFGRDFKLYGYVSSDNKPHFPPIAFAAQESFTHTQTNLTGPVTPGTRLNDNWATDQASFYYAGVIIPNRMGAFIQGTYDGTTRQFFWDTTDIRYARDDGSLFGEDIVWGIDVNNSPTAQDIWNSTPGWGFPYASTKFAAGGPPGTLIEGALSSQVAGVGPYIMWNDMIYAEASVYRQFGSHDIGLLTGGPTQITYDLPGVTPYWRTALQNSWDKGKYYAQIGSYGMTAAVNPNGDFTTGKQDHYTDLGFDANFQWYENTKNVTADIVSAHATWIREDQSLGATYRLGNSANPDNRLNTMRADVSYAIGATWIPTFQYFKTTGSSDAIVFNGSPNAEGFVAEIGYSPWGKPDSPVNWANARITLQYTNYTEVGGTSAHATDNNIIYLNFWTAFGLNPF